MFHSRTIRLRANKSGFNFRWQVHSRLTVCLRLVFPFGFALQRYVGTLGLGYGISSDNLGCWICFT